MKRDFKEFKDFIRNKNVAVVGIGVSNIPLINFLVDLGAKVTAFDRKNEKESNKAWSYRLRQSRLGNAHEGASWQGGHVHSCRCL